MKKIFKVFFSISIFINIIFLFNLFYNNNNGTISFNESESINDNVKRPCFDIIGLVNTNIEKKIHNDSVRYKSTIGMYVGNLKGDMPYILLADSISTNGELIGKVDSISTNYWVGDIEKSFSIKANQILYGKYFFKFEKDSDYQSINFTFPME